MKQCSWEGCDKPVRRNDLCNTHSHQLRRGVPLTPIKKQRRGMSVEDRLQDMSEDQDGCRVWTHSLLASGGYGQINVGGVPRRAHVVAYEQVHGPVPEGMFVCHTCDNPPCINVDHLFLGSAADNAADMARKGRSTRGERNRWAVLTEDQVIEIRAQVSGGARQRDVAGRFGVSQATVSDICRRKSWAYLT